MPRQPLDDIPRAERYLDIPIEVRGFLENLRPEDVPYMRRAIYYMRWAETSGRFVRYLFFGVTAIIIVTAVAGDSIQKVFGWFGWFGGSK